MNTQMPGGGMPGSGGGMPQGPPPGPPSGPPGSGLPGGPPPQMPGGPGPGMPGGPGMPPAPEKASGMAVAALILAILGIPCCIPGIVGIVLGIIELGRINRGESPMKGKGLATAAIIVGAVGIGINLIFTIISIATGGFSFEVTT